MRDLLKKIGRWLTRHVILLVVIIAMLVAVPVAADLKLTTCADIALTSAYRVAVVVNGRSAQLAKTDQF